MPLVAPRLRLLSVTVLALVLASRLAGQPPTYIPSQENLAARGRYQDAKFGMFIHWGVSSVLMDGEWVMQHRGITAAEYESVAPLFKPRQFDARVWGRDRKDGRPAGIGEFSALPGLHRRPVDGTANCLWTDRRNMVRWRVGSTRSRRLASREQWVHLQHARRPAAAKAMGRDDAKGRHCLPAPAGRCRPGVTLTLPKRDVAAADQVVALVLGR